MLISFSKRFVMEGEATFLERKHFWNKKEEVREKIYCYSGISGVCDDSELDAEVERLTKNMLSSSGWGDKFHGWNRILDYEESVEVAKNNGWDTDGLPECKLTTKTLDTWTVDKAAKKLTGKQFAQYCKDYGIVLRGE